MPISKSRIYLAKDYVAFCQSLQFCPLYTYVSQVLVNVIKKKRPTKTVQKARYCGLNEFVRE